ncbi:MAG TPA: glycoside hydrolase family 15 protein [Ktedonobacterales bacterium]
MQSESTDSATTVTGVRADSAQIAMRYRPLAQYGVIGDCRSAALVGPDGSIDWCCLPHFDSEAILLRLLDASRGGYFRVHPRNVSATQMEYLPGTNVLETRLSTSGGRLRLLDFMPVRQRRPGRDSATPLASLLPGGLHSPALEREAGNDIAAAHRINRLATCLSGVVTLDVALKATFNYAREPAVYESQPVGDGALAALVSAPGRALVFLVRRLPSNATVEGSLEQSLAIEQDVLRAQMNLHAGERAVAVLQYARDLAEARTLLATLLSHDFDADTDETLSYWHEWTARSRYSGPYQQAVERSALALKLCTFEPTGAIVAAPTTSLPELIGGTRNWDYRYTWLRDSAFTLGALAAIGHHEEARDYFHFLHDLQIRSGSDLKVLYSILGYYGAQLEEQTLDHLEGYRGSRPVRIGNAAAEQRQLDIYGELLDAAYTYVAQDGFRTFLRLHEANRDLRRLSVVLAEYVERHWQDLDRGIWEVRGPARAFVYSRAMCWVAMQRAIAIGEHSIHHRRLARWQATANRIRAEVLERGYDAALGSFTQAYGNRTLDAANLRLPLVDFLLATDPRMHSTIDVTSAGLRGSDGFLYRYRPATLGSPANDNPQELTDDGLPGTEGVFLACTFWLVSDLCNLGRLEEARALFEQLLEHASPLGLYSEELDPTTGEMLGNYPQAFTHIGLINAAAALEAAVQGHLPPQAPPAHPGQ